MIFSLIKYFTNKILKSIIIFRFGFEGTDDIHTQTAQIQKICYNDPANYREFWSVRGKQPRHIRHISIKGDKNNNLMERLNGEFRDREKIFRGLKKKDSPAITGIKLYHNYVRPHMSLNGETPADRAGIIIKGSDKWRTLIENASLG